MQDILKQAFVDLFMQDILKHNLMRPLYATKAQPLLTLCNPYLTWHFPAFLIFLTKTTL